MMVICKICMFGIGNVCEKETNPDHYEGHQFGRCSVFRPRACFDYLDFDFIAEMAAIMQNHYSDSWKEIKWGYPERARINDEISNDISNAWNLENRHERVLQWVAVACKIMVVAHHEGER